MQPISHCVGQSVGWLVGQLVGQTFTFVFGLYYRAAQIITAPAQLITAPAQPPATGAAVYNFIWPCF